MYGWVTEVSAGSAEARLAAIVAIPCEAVEAASEAFVSEVT